ncbi:MAG: proteasome subunit alpha [Mycobacteriales bacterium]
MAMQFYASPEQIMRDRSEYARKGIARGRSVVVLSYADGVLFVAENPSKALHKVSEIYDRIGFAAVGKYNEFENLRTGGVRLADMRGYQFDRRDVTGRALANTYAQTLGAIFTEQSKPYEVELCVAEVGDSPEEDELYRLTYDGSVGDEPGYVAMGGQSESITANLKEKYNRSGSLQQALGLAVSALASVGGENGKKRSLTSKQLEVAVLDRSAAGRAFRRVVGTRLETLLEPPSKAAAGGDDAEVIPASGPDKVDTGESPQGAPPASADAPASTKSKPGGTAKSSAKGSEKKDSR